MALGAAWALPARAFDVPLVFAAASLKTVLDDIVRELPMRLNYGGSGALARQITYGAPADLFISANRQWMRVVEERGMLASPARPILSNSLVLVAPSGTSEVTVRDIVGRGHIATGFVNAVPAGQYAKAALTALGLWEALESQIVQTENVRAALALVARGEVPWGVVYATDALAEGQVSVVARFDQATYPEIIYEAGLLKSSAHTDTFDALQSVRVQDVFRRHGFGVF